jgi:hypothetical protein
MALIGNYTKHTATPHETETVEIQITNPEGVTETIQTPKLISEIEIIEDVYVIISHYMFYPIFLNDNEQMGFDFQWKIYASKQDRQNDSASWIEEGGVMGQFFDIASSDDIRKKAYEILSEQIGFEDLTND